MRDKVRDLTASTLIVGSKIYKKRPDWRLNYPTAVGVDMLEGEGVDVVMNLETDALPTSQFAHIVCISVLEHSRNPFALAANLEQSLIKGGTIEISVPFAWRVHGYPSDYWRFTVEGVKVLFPNIEWDSLNMISYNEQHDRLPCITHDEKTYFARTEIIGIGKRL